MKKIIFLALSIFVVSALSAQTEYDALRISQTDIVGSARYMSMGGAFGALGGDASALKDNPAGLGVYRSGEVSATLNAMFQKSNSMWYDQANSATNGLGMKFNNVTYVMSIPLYEDKSSGLLQSNFSFGYNRVKNFNRVMRASGMTNSSFSEFAADFTNQNRQGITEADLKYVQGSYEPYDQGFIPWMAILAYDGFLMEPNAENPPVWSSTLLGQATTTSTMIESGGISEYSFGWGGNFNNNLFIGANLNITDMYYSLDSWLDEDYGKSDMDFTLQNRLTQTGMGVNLKLGAIYLPTNNFRLGLAFHTPTMTTISETAYARLDYFNVNKSIRDWSKTNDGKGSHQNFNIITPLQAQLSAAYLFGRKGLISFEYNFVDYTGNRFQERGGDNTNINDPFEPENLGMKEVLQNGHVFKLGGEFKPTTNVSLRAGYAMLTGSTNPNYADGKKMRLNTVSTIPEYFEQKGANYFSLGVGYREASWFVDLSYALKVNNENFYPYQWNRTDLQAADISTNTNNIALTLGIRM